MTPHVPSAKRVQARRLTKRVTGVYAKAREEIYGVHRPRRCACGAKPAWESETGTLRCGPCFAAFLRDHPLTSLKGWTRL